MSAYVVKQFKDVYYRRQYNLVQLWVKYAYGERQSLIEKTINKGITYALGTRQNDEFFILGHDCFNIYVWAKTIAFVLSVFAFLHVCSILIIRVIKATFPNKTSSIEAPQKFTKTTNVVEYLELFDMYLEEERIDQDCNKHNALLSRMDLECVKLIKNYSEQATKSYESIKEAMLCLFSINKCSKRFG
jgi:hypothetical protein